MPERHIHDSGTGDVEKDEGILGAEVLKSLDLG